MDNGVLKTSDAGRRDLLATLMVGCDRETAAHYVGTILSELRRQLAADPHFAADVRRAEARAELAHIRNIYNAASDAKNWRASVWWLERRSPERYGSRGAGVVTERQLQAFVDELAAAFELDVHDGNDRERLLARLRGIDIPCRSMDGTTAEVQEEEENDPAFQ
jgi:hypothetical protein